MVQVIFVVLNLHGYGEFVAAVDLGPAGNPGDQAMDSSLGPQIHQVKLVEQGRPRPNETHVSSQHAVKLRQLVQAEFPQHVADGRDPAFRIVEKMGGEGRSPLAHGPEFRHSEDGVVSADPVGPIYGLSFRAEPDQNSEQEHGTTENSK